MSSSPETDSKREGDNDLDQEELEIYSNVGGFNSRFDHYRGDEPSEQKFSGRKYVTLCFTFSMIRLNFQSFSSGPRSRATDKKLANGTTGGRGSNYRMGELDLSFASERKGQAHDDDGSHYFHLLLLLSF